MRKKEREITDRREVERIIRECRVVRLGMSMDNVPYVVPLSFGYDGQCLYFHCAKEGRKIDFLRANPLVCFQFECGVELKMSDKSPCSWGFHFQSVIGYGTAEELNSEEDKVFALNRIMAQYSEGEFDFPEKAVAATAAWRVRIDSMTGKHV